MLITINKNLTKMPIHNLHNIATIQKPSVHDYTIFTIFLTYPTHINFAQKFPVPNKNKEKSRKSRTGLIINTLIAY